MTVSSKVLTFLITNLSVLHNYFDGSNKSIFSDLYLAKFLDTSKRSFHSYLDTHSANYEREHVKWLCRAIIKRQHFAISSQK